MKKTLITILATVLVCCCVVGGTLAWLMDKTAPITNTFTVGNVDIELNETGTTDNAKSFKMVPGSTIAKDPKVTVKANSERCWVFVKIDESANLDDFITYTVATGWAELTAGSGVYYRDQAATDVDVTYSVLAGDAVTVNNTVTKDQMDAITVGTATAPTLTFTAYAVQYDATSITTAAEAWTIATTPAP